MQKEWKDRSTEELMKKITETNRGRFIDWLVVGGVLMDSTILEDVLDIISEYDFYNHEARQVWRVILDMRNNQVPVIDMFTVSSELERREGGSEGHWISILGDSVKECPSRLQTIQYAKAVKEKSNEYKIYNLLLSSARDEFKNVTERLEFIRKKTEEIENGMYSEINDYGNSINNVIAQIDSIFNKENKLTGVSTGFRDLDEKTNGLQNGDFIVLGARPSMGKTMLATNIADNMAIKNKKPVAFFSMEMSADKLCLRTLSRFAQIPHQKLTRGELTEENWQKLPSVTDHLKAGKLFVNDKPSMTVAEMRAYARKIKNLHGLSCIFVDYLGLIGGEGENETLKVGNISRELKAMARDLNVPVFCLVQLNRDLEKRNDKHPMMCDIRQSGNIEQDADIILFLHRDSRDSVEADLDIAKHRNGVTGRIKLRVRNELMLFEDSIY